MVKPKGWGVEARINALRWVYLPRMGATWQGSSAAFIEYVHRSIELMPEPTRTAMRRYYVWGDSQEKDEETGKVVKQDNHFHNLLIRGRTALATRIKEAEGEKRLTELLERIYGY